MVLLLGDFGVAVGFNFVGYLCWMLFGYFGCEVRGFAMVGGVFGV